jgi:hypothetical protein
MMTQKDISADKIRVRTNILKTFEASAIAFLCKIMPSWVTSDLLTFVGFTGSLIVAAGLYLGTDNRYWLFLSVLGYAVGWFGDSLDGRLAYFRNIPRKWYGWALDISVDWITVFIMGAGYYYYFTDYKFFAFVFVFAYGWAMINSLLKYKITNTYSIDTFLMGPTEVRIIICLFMAAEVFLSGSLLFLSIGGSLLLAIFNIVDLVQLLKFGDIRDIEEKSQK